MVGSLWLPPYRLCQLATLIIADIPGRSTNETGDGVALRVLGHVETGHSLLGVKQLLGKSFAQLSLAYAGRANEEEDAEWPVRRLQVPSERAYSHSA